MAELDYKEGMREAVAALDTHIKEINNGGKIHVRNNQLVTDSVCVLAGVADQLSSIKLVELIIIIANQCYVSGYHDGKTSIENLIGKG